MRGHLAWPEGDWGPRRVFRETVYTVEHDTEGVTRITTDQASGRRTVVRTTEGEVITNLPDGTRILTTLAESPLHPELDYEAATQVVLPNGDTLWSSVEPGEIQYQDGLIQAWQTSYHSGPPNGEEVLEHLFERLNEGWQETLTTAAGREAYLRYDADGRLIESGVANLASTEYAYDQDGRLTEMAAGDRITTMTYNMWGRLAVVTDPLGRQLRHTYSGAGGDLTSIGLYADAQAQVPIQLVEFTFDENGNLTSLTPPNDEVHASTYNAVDLEVSYTPPEVDPENAMVTQADWTPDRRLRSLETGDDSIEFQYTPTGRQRAISYFHDTIWFSYHPDGNPAAMETANGNIAMRFAWNGSLLTGENLTVEEVELGRILYGYDPLGRAVDQTLEVGQVVHALHAALTDGELTGVGRGTGANYVEDLGITRNAAGLPHVLSIGDLDTTYTYNAHGEVLTETTTDSQGVVFARAYTRDALGRITQVDETEGANSRKLFYTYDIAGRLVAECLGTALGQGDDACGADTALIAEYTYDANGNRLTRDEPGGAIEEEAEYDAQDRLVDYAGVAHTFGDRGELQTAGDWSFDYDALGNLVQASQANGPTISYLIDPRNRRIGRDDGVTQRYWLYQDQLEPVAELDGNGDLVARFVHGIRAHSPDYLVRWEAQQEVLYRYVTDHLGSVRMVVRVSDGQVVQRLDYDAFGRVLTDTNPGFQPFGFAGGLYDPATGLVRFGARDYDPQTGRWTAKDPIRWAGGQANLYEYVGSDPVNFIDPSGLIEVTVDDYSGGISDPASWVLFLASSGSVTGVDSHGSLLGALAARVNEFGEKIDTLYIRGHGEDGKVYLRAALDSQVSLRLQMDRAGNTVGIEGAEVLRSISSLFTPDANVFLLTCNSAETKVGYEFVRHLAMLWGVTVHASPDAQTSLRHIDGRILTCWADGTCVPGPFTGCVVNCAP